MAQQEQFVVWLVIKTTFLIAWWFYDIDRRITCTVLGFIAKLVEQSFNNSPKRVRI